MNLHRKEDTLTACDREPIHHIAAVQPFGGLVAAHGDGTLAHASANLAGMLGLAAHPAPGTPMDAIFAASGLAAIGEALAALSGKDMPERRFGIALAKSGARFDFAVHRSGGLSIIEFEPHAAQGFADHVAMIVPVIARLEALSDPQALCETAARLVREMLGYDRVMIYRFHPDESGEVVAEERADDMEPYLGLRYPAADIPQQARELFRRNRFRVIADMDAEAVPIVPELGPEDAPLDLSMSMLRAHSQMHLAYMRNMGVRASLAIAIVRHDRLWGMISCHHREPRLPAYSLRTVAELLSQTFSLMLDRMLVAHTEGLRQRARELGDRLLLRLTGGVALAESLPQIEEVLGGAIPHDGISLLVGGEYRARGAAPDEAAFRALAPLLASTLGGSIHATTRLADQLAEAAPFADTAAGALVLPLSGAGRDCLVLWRRPLERTVTWAGDPDKARAAPGELLQPRASFAAWAEIVRGRGAEWTAEECEVAARLRRTLIEVILRLGEDVARERARAAEAQDLVIAELNHRVRNILGLIRGLVSQSQHEALSVPGFAAILGGRIAALAAAHDNLTAAKWSPASLTSLIGTELAPYLGSDPARLRLTGEDALLSPEAYTVLALVVHELATNSAKYGALSVPSGRLEIRLARTAFGDLALRWRESGGPPVSAPNRRGFGSTIIERSIPQELRGEADVRFRLSGLEADFLVPARHVTAPEPVARALEMPADPAPTPAPITAPAPASLPRSVLLVEDSIIIALDTEENLKRLGIAEVRIESTVAGALAAIAERAPDLALIDFDLGGESSEPIAAALVAADVRFVLATGYDPDQGDFARLGAAAVLKKPYGREDIAIAIGTPGRTA